MIAKNDHIFFVQPTFNELSFMLGFRYEGLKTDGRSQAQFGNAEESKVKRTCEAERASPEPGHRRVTFPSLFHYVSADSKLNLSLSLASFYPRRTFFLAQV